MIDCSFIRKRITRLRLEKNVSEYEMSYVLGHSRGYIYNISSGKALPTMHSFLEICDYFSISPAEFFADDASAGVIQQDKKELYSAIENLKEEDVALVTALVQRLNRKDINK